MNDAIKTKVTAPKLTEAQRRVLATKDGMYVHGGDIAAAKALVRRGFGSMTDDGYCRYSNEQYIFSANDAGRAALRGES